MKITTKNAKLMLTRISQLLSISFDEAKLKYGVNEKKLTRICKKLSETSVASKDANDVFSELDDYDPGEKAVEHVVVLTESDKKAAEAAIEKINYKAQQAAAMQESHADMVREPSSNTTSLKLPPIPDDKLGFD